MQTNNSVEKKDFLACLGLSYQTEEVGFFFFLILLPEEVGKQPQEKVSSNNTKLILSLSFILQALLLFQKEY